MHPQSNALTCEICGAAILSQTARRFCSPACRHEGHARYWQARRDATWVAGVKTCAKCGETKSVSAFGKHLKGLKARCKDCCREDRKSFYDENHTAMLAYARVKYLENRDACMERHHRWLNRNRGHTLAYCRAYNETHREQRRESDRRRRAAMPVEVRRAKWREENARRRDKLRVYCVKNRERRAAYLRQWRKDHPEKHAEKQARRRARVKCAPMIELIDRARLIERLGRICYLCGTRLTQRTVTVDHVIPLARGGEHSVRNLRVCCRSCNTRKGAKLWHELQDAYPSMAERVRCEVERAC